MLEGVISQAHVNAVSACEGFPYGLAYDECYTWAVAEYISSNQVSEERTEFLIILAFVTAITFFTTLLLKNQPAPGGPTDTVSD